jgi:Zn-dependent metalloprotease
MRGDPALADINSSVREELAQMIIGPAITKPKFEHVALQALDQPGREIKASALRLQPADEAV